MTQRRLQEQVRDEFSTLTRPPGAHLGEGIRDCLYRPAAARGRFRLPRPLAALIAGLLVLAVVAAVLVGPAAMGTAGSVGQDLNLRVARVLTPPTTAARSNGAAAPPSPAATPSGPAPATPTSTPSPAPTEAASPAPPAATPPVATLPGYSCAVQTGGGGRSAMTMARVGDQSGYDRFVVQFAGPVPAYEVTLQDGASFAQGGAAVTLRGAAGLRVVLHDATGAGTYAGPSDTAPGFPAIQEVRLLSDSQGTVEWGVGIAQPACFHAWTLGGPSRLVIDVAK